MLEEKIKTFVNRINDLTNSISTEEATKTSLVMPFFSLLGYDIFNPTEFIPEYTADVGIKKGEKVDYAIVLNDEPTILIEVKSVTEKLEKHDSQLFRYFGTTNAKFSILTNGVIYKFYTDLDEPNKMDLNPFLEVNLLDLTDNDIAELKKFAKEKFDIRNILNTASDLKYTGLIKKNLKEEFLNPSEKFVKLLVTSDVYEGRFTQPIMEKFQQIVKKSISAYVNDLVNEKIKNALISQDEQAPMSESDGETIESLIETGKSDIVTTEEEIQSYYIVKSILATMTEPSRITYKDTASYFGILLDGKVTKWICRICLKETVKYIIIPNNGENIKYSLTDINDIYSYSQALINRVNELS